MQCVECNEFIDDDSYFCDQCGVEIIFCTECAIPVKTKYCNNCGKEAEPASTQLLDATRVSPHSASEQNSSPSVLVSTAVSPENINSSIELPEVPKLRLRNINLSLDLIITEECVIGRDSGGMSDVFCQFKRVSGRHCRLFFMEIKDSWLVEDFGSTNNTYVNNVLVTPTSSVPLKQGDYLKIAHIEFYVSIGV
jgi:hypothetical protein